METHISYEQDRKLLSLYEIMYAERALRSKGEYNKLRLLQQEIKQIHKSIFATFLFVSQFISDMRVNKFFFYLKVSKLEK